MSLKVAPYGPVDLITEDVEDRKASVKVPKSFGTNSPVDGRFEIDVAVERRVRKKLDRVVVTLLFLAYLLAFLDRSNIGNAEAASMSKDLGFNDKRYEWLLTIFYIPYILFEWCAIMWKIIPPHIWAAVTIGLWGLASTLQAAAFNWEGLMACRWFLATAEAAFGPGVPYLLSFFYKRNELGIRCGIFVSAAPLSTTFAGALAYAITSDHTTIASWRLLFIIEGIPTFVLAIAVYLFLPDSPDTARFLTPEERDVAKARTILQTGKEGKDRLGSIEWLEALSALKSPQTLIQPLMYFSCNVSFASLPVFLPTILHEMGYSSINAQGLTVPPYFLAFLVCMVTTYLADRTGQRGLMIAGLSVLGGIGYILLATVRSVAGRYLGVFLAAAGVFPAIANILPWVLGNQGTDTKRGVGIAMLNIIGQCGPLLGTRMFPKSEGPFFVKGMAVCAAFMLFNAFLALTLRVYFARLNEQLAEAELTLETDTSGRTIVPVGTEIEGSFGYRYVL